MKLLYIQDPGHGWLLAPGALVRQLGITPSRYSYYNRAGDQVYLEEDCDAGEFMRALRATGATPEIQEVHLPHDAACRSLPRWGDA